MMGAQRAAPFRMWTLCVSKVGSVPGPPSEFHLRLPSPSVLPRHLLISPPPPPPSHLILVFLLLLRLPPGSLCFILLLIIIILLLLLILPPPTLPPPPLPFVSLAHGSRVPSRVNRGGIPRARGHEYYSPLSPDWHSSAGSSRPEPGLHCNPGRLRYQCNPLHCNPFSPAQVPLQRRLLRPALRPRGGIRGGRGAILGRLGAIAALPTLTLLFCSVLF